MIILNPFSQSADQQSLPVEQRMLRFSKDLSILSDYDLMQHIQPIRHREQFQNWGQSARCQPLAVMRPNTEEEVQLVIELARRQGREIRCFGAGHSPSDLVCSSDYMMNLDRLSGLIKVTLPDCSADPQKRLAHGVGLFRWTRRVGVWKSLEAHVFTTSINWRPRMDSHSQP